MLYGHSTRRPTPLLPPTSSSTVQWVTRVAGNVLVTGDADTLVESTDGDLQVFAHGRLCGPVLAEQHGPVDLSDLAAFIASDSAFNDIYGSFAAVAIGPSPNCVRLVRDYPGMCPLYYAVEETGIIFSTNYEHLAGNTDQTVRFVQPGYLATISSDNIQSQSFYQPHYAHVGNDPIATLDELLAMTTRQLFQEAMSDSSGQVSVFLSGGVDSSLIAYYLSQATDNVVALTLDGKDDAFARLAAEAIGVGLEILRVEPETWSRLSDIYPHRPYNINFHALTNSLFVPTLILCSATDQRNMRVAFSGTGSDEIFASYNLHQQYMKDISYATLQIMADCHVFLLEALDLAATLSGVTCFTPFFGREVIDFALNLSDDFKIHNSVEKWIVRKIAEQYLPKQIAWREPGPLHVTTNSFEKINGKNYYESYYR